MLPALPCPRGYGFRMLVLSQCTPQCYPRNFRNCIKKDGSSVWIPREYDLVHLSIRVPFKPLLDRSIVFFFLCFLASCRRTEEDPLEKHTMHLTTATNISVLVIVIVSRRDVLSWYIYTHMYPKLYTYYCFDIRYVRRHSVLSVTYV